MPNNFNVLGSLFDKDEDEAIEQIRGGFISAIDGRDFDRYEALLNILSDRPSPKSQMAYKHYSAIFQAEKNQQYAQAEHILRDVLAGSPTDLQRARTTMELANQLDELGLWEDSNLLYDEAFEMYSNLDYAFGQATTMMNKGVSLAFQVEYGPIRYDKNKKEAALNDAIGLHQQSIRYLDASRNNYIGRNWHGIGRCYGLLGKYEDAKDAFQKARTIFTDSGAYELAITTSDLSYLVQMPNKQFVEAGGNLAKVIEVMEEEKEELDLAENLFRYGQLFHLKGNTDAALEKFEEAIKNTESIRSRLTTAAAKAQYRVVIDDMYVALVTTHLEDGSSSDAFSITERARARTLADLLAGQTARPASNLSTDLIKERENIRQELESAYHNSIPEQEQRQLEDALVEKDRQIEFQDPAYGALKSVKSLSAKEVQKRLPQNSVLVTYSRDLDDRLWILTVTTKAVNQHRVEKPDVMWLDNFLRKYFDGDGTGMIIPNEKEERNELLSADSLFRPLFKALIKPILSEIEEAQTVYFVPYGPLHYIPLGCLYITLTDGSPLVLAEKRIVYTPSATVLLNYSHQREPSANEKLLSFAPSDKKLLYTEGTAKSIANAFDGHAIIGDSATRQAFLMETQNYQVVCFLGHAHFDGRHAMLSHLLATDDEKLRASDILQELRLDADLVVLGACETGRGEVLRGDELLGLTRALLYAGTPSVLVTLWKVHEIPTRLLLEYFFQEMAKAKQPDPARHLVRAQKWLRSLTVSQTTELLSSWEEISEEQITLRVLELWKMTAFDQEISDNEPLFLHPYFWSPYILVGDRLLT